MELRRSVRQAAPKWVDDASEDEEKPLSKRVKINNETSSTSFPNGVRRSQRARKQNELYKNYDPDSDFDSDYDSRRSKSKKGRRSYRRGVGQIIPSKLELVLSWKRDMIVNNQNKPSKSKKIVTTSKIADCRLSDHGNNLQALFINIRWKTEYNQKGITIEEFRKINLDRKLMKSGIVFMWSEKELLWKIMKEMEKKEFVYIENLAIVLLDPTKMTEGKEPSKFIGDKETPKVETTEEVKIELPQKAGRSGSKGKKTQTPETASLESDTTSHTVNKGAKNDKASANKFATEEKAFLEQLHNYNGVEANDLFLNTESKYFKNTKKVLLMFRKIAEGKDKNLELRHQRTPDVFFSTANPLDPQGTDIQTKEAVYKMIETLLPKAAYDETESHPKFKMMELWADEERTREGWISVCETRTTA